MTSHAALGDLAAGTFVIRESQPVTLAELNTTSSVVALSDTAKAEAATLPIYRLSREQLEVAREFIQRRAAMSKPQRTRMGMQIGTAIARQMAVLLPVQPEQAEHLLELVVGTKTSEG